MEPSEALLADGEIEQSRGFTCDDAIEMVGFGRFQKRLLFVTGALFSADAMQMMLVSFISPAARCDFDLSIAQEALIASIVFVGMFVGSYLCGTAADKYGRRIVFLGSAACVSFFGLFSACAMFYEMLLFGQFMVGIGIGGVPVAFSLFAEFIPASERGEKLVLLQVFWTLGALGEAALAWIVMPILGWRWLFVFSALPSLALLALHKYVPESPRWQSATGKNRVACESLHAVSLYNGQEWKLGDYQDLQVTKAKENDASILDLFEDGYTKITLVLWALWLSCTLLYYGVILLSTQVFKTHHHHVGDLPIGHCHRMDADDFARAFITATAEIPSLVIAVLMIDRYGRRITLVCSFAGIAVFLFFLAFLNGYMWWETFAIFCARAAANCAFTVVYISTGEMYPTAIRTTGLGTASAMARIGGFMAPFVADVLFDASRFIALMVFVFFAAATARIAYELPETGGATLPDAVPSASKVAAKIDENVLAESPSATST